MFHVNTQAARRPYDADLRPWLSLAEGRAARERLSNWVGLSRRPHPAVVTTWPRATGRH